MSTQTGMTFYDAQTGQGITLNTGNGGYYRTISNIGITRGGGLILNGPCHDFFNIHIVGCGINANSYSVQCSYNNHPSQSKFTNIFITNSAGTGFCFGQGELTVINLFSCNNLSYGILNVNYGPLCSIYNAILCNNLNGILSYPNINIYNLITASNTTCIVANDRNQSGSSIHLINPVLNESSPISAFNSFTNHYIVTKNFNNTGTHKIFTDNGYIQSESGSNRRTGNGLSWGLYPTSTTRDAFYPLKYKLATLPCASGTAVAFKGWSSRNNTNISCGFLCPSGQIGGPIQNASGLISSASGVWEQISLAWTPTENGIVDIYAIAYGGTNSGAFFDDLDVLNAYDYFKIKSIDIDKNGEPYCYLSKQQQLASVH